MKEIQLENNMVVIVDDEDYEQLKKYRWYSYKKDDRNTCYARRSNGRSRKIFIHQQILGKVEGLVIDHINGDGLDNRRENLRHVTHRQNSMNRHDKKTSQYRGIWWHKQVKKWCAQIQINGKQKHIGLYRTEIEAFEAYKKAVESVGDSVV
jgi:hypothetical protein